MLDVLVSTHNVFTWGAYQVCSLMLSLDSLCFVQLTAGRHETVNGVTVHGVEVPVAQDIYGKEHMVAVLLSIQQKQFFI